MFFCLLHMCNSDTTVKYSRAAVKLPSVDQLEVTKGLGTTDIN